MISETEITNMLKELLPCSRYILNKKHSIPFFIKSVDSPIFFAGEMCGRVDLIVKNKQNKSDGVETIIEIKGYYGDSCGGTEMFWDSCKVLAYAKILGFINNTKYQRGVMFPAEFIRPSICAMSYVLGMSLYSYRVDEKTRKITIEDELSKLFGRRAGR
jgi:hypothetical protein